MRLPHHWSYHILVYNGSDADKLHIRSQEGLIQTAIDEKACSIHCHSSFQDVLNWSHMLKAAFI